MRLKKVILSIIFTIILLNSPKSYAATSGWVKEQGKTYYYENGEKITGFQDIEGKRYFFSYINGALKSG